MNKLSRKLRRWQALEPWERLLLLRLLWLLPATWLALRYVGFRRAQRLAEIRPHLGAAGANVPDFEYAERCARLTEIAARHGLYRANCLHQSLALCRVLCRRGLPAKIRIGVKSALQPFEAHAWVEIDGIPVGQLVEDYCLFPESGVRPVPPSRA